ncbi:MFS transporter [Oceanispirochaeta crateris]|uniref:MFS transporter n=1 Tax=Oceanispirochaeta crateris TaxID=2518645 RepID=UPI00143DC2D2|nr:MFS transporter [Oceanispirochaeta crateris]
MKEKSFTPFLIVWTGQLLSGLGTGITAFTFGIYVFNQTNSTISFAMVMLTLFVPAILIGPIGGVFADRFDRRVMIIIGDTGSAVAVMFLLFFTLSGRLFLWNIYLGIAMSSAFTALQGPAYKALLSDMLIKSQYSKAGGLMQLASSAKHLLAPICGGFLLAYAGIECVLLLDILTFAFAIMAVVFVPAVEIMSQNRKGFHFFNEMRNGWKSLIETPEVMQIVIKLTTVTFFIGCIQTLFTPMMLSLTTAKTLGIILSLSALGMVVGSLIISVTGLGKDLYVPLRLGLALGGIFLTIMGMSTHLVIISIFLFLFFICLPLINISAEVLIRTKVPNQKQGRTWGLTGFLTQIGYVAAYLSAGFLTDKLFNPLLQDQGVLAFNLRHIVGSEPGRGQALILMICGLGLFLTALSGGKR